MLSFASLIFGCAALLAGPAQASIASPDEAVFAALKLGTEYNSAARPPPDNGTANTINVYVFLFNLVSVDSASQQVTLQVWLEKQWFDSRLSWLEMFNSSLSNVTELYLQPGLVWRPDLAFQRVIELKDASLDPSQVLVNKSGSVFEGRELLLTFKCQMAMMNFPFDTQKCVIWLTSRMQSKRTLELNVKTALGGDATPGNFLMKSNDFCVRKVQIKKSVFLDQDMIFLLLDFQRRPVFYLTNLILPSILILAVSAVAFRMPPECGERISFSITIVLSLCVFLQLAGNYTPTQSESVPLISWYFGAVVLMTMANVICNVFVLDCQFKQQRISGVNNRLIRALFLNRFIARSFWQPKISASDAPDQQSRRPVDGNEWAIVVLAADRVFFAVFAAIPIFLIVCVVIMTLSYSQDCVVGSVSAGFDFD